MFRRHVCLCTMYMSALPGQKKGFDLLELELQLQAAMWVLATEPSPPQEQPVFFTPAVSSAPSPFFDRGLVVSGLIGMSHHPLATNGSLNLNKSVKISLYYITYLWF